MLPQPLKSEIAFIDDQAIWLEMLRSRNSMSHIYDDQLATRIAQRIDVVFLPVLQALAQTFQP